MLKLNVYKMLYLVIGLLGGCVLLAATVLTYLAIWRPRKESDLSRIEPTDGWKGIREHTPWIIWLTIAAIVTYGLIFTVAKAINPPNW